MSYDIDLKAPPCSTCGRSDPSPECPGPTYNLTQIFDLALTGETYPNPDVTEGQAVVLRTPTSRPRGLRLLHGRRASTTIADLTRALERMEDPAMESAFLALEPPNKWGTFMDAVAVVQQLRQLAKDHPHHLWGVQ